MQTGTYALLLELPRPRSIAVGQLGRRSFRNGCYVYIGSAFGAGGLGRVGRHRRVAAGYNPTRHWHIDHLLPYTDMLDVYVVEDEDIECAVAGSIPGARIPEFGSTDCGCESHLVFADDVGAIREWLRTKFGHSIGLARY